MDGSAEPGISSWWASLIGFFLILVVAIPAAFLSEPLASASKLIGAWLDISPLIIIVGVEVVALTSIVIGSFVILRYVRPWYLQRLIDQRKARES